MATFKKTAGAVLAFVLAMSASAPSGSPAAPVSGIGLTGEKPESGKTIYSYLGSSGTIMVSARPSSKVKPGFPAILGERVRSGALKRIERPLEIKDGEFKDLVNLAARKHGIQPALVMAVVKCESNFNPRAVSPSGAKGLMQLMDATAKYLGIDNAYDPSQNVMAGSMYLARLLKEQNGNVALALAAYNAGPGTVARCGGIPPIPATIEYVKKVMFYRDYYARFCSRTPEETNFMTKAVKAFETDDLPRAILFSRQALEFSPEDPVINYNLGLFFDLRDMPHPAEKHYLKAIEVDRYMAEPHWNLARLLEARGDFVEAGKHWRCYAERARDPVKAAEARKFVDEVLVLAEISGSASRGE